MWMAVLCIAVGVYAASTGFWTTAIRRLSSGKGGATEWASTILGVSFVLLGLRDAFTWHAPVRITLTSLATLLLVIAMTLNAVALRRLGRQKRDARRQY